MMCIDTIKTLALISNFDTPTASSLPLTILICLITTIFSLILVIMESQNRSILLDRKHWERNPQYFFKTIPPRVSKYAQRADDACIQTQIDVWGRENIGIIQGSLAKAANFAAVIYAESLPDRLPVLAYLNEVLSFYEGRYLNQWK
jgi:hypothetical protein